MDYRAMPTVPSLRQRQPRPADPGTLPDRTRSSVILIGTSTHDHYRELDDLPAVAHNLIDLRGALTDPSSGAFEPQRTHVLLDEGPYLPAKIAELGEDVGDTLLVYFAGHGLVAPNGELCLARRDTRPALEAYTTMPFSLLRQAVKDSPAKRKIVILDCCFAGRALPTLLASDPIHGQMEISGTYVLTATADNQPAHVTPGARNSVFTGELLNVLNAGIVDGEELIQLGELYEVLRRRLHASNLPLPRQMGIDTVGSLAIARNPGWTGY
jgi:ATP-dependent Clp protease ATP-binding subunit ClpC